MDVCFFDDHDIGLWPRKTMWAWMEDLSLGFPAKLASEYARRLMGDFLCNNRPCVIVSAKYLSNILT